MGWIARRLGIRDRDHRPTFAGERRIRMRDGTELRAHHFAPHDPGKHPTILVRTPYGIGWHPPLFLLPLFARTMAGRGYNVLLQDTRGRYGSAGDFYPFVHESDDGEDTAAWIADQPWFDGRLGMWGPSYLGYTQWAVARHKPEYLRALVPIITSTDFYSTFYPGGAFSLITSLRWASSNGDRRGQMAPERRLPAAARTRPVRDASRAVGRPAAFFEDWTDHPSADEYWERVNLVDARDGPAIPTLQIAGTYDMFCGPQMADFAAGDASMHLDLGPMAHGTPAIPPRRLGWRNASPARLLASSLQFFDHHLLGHDLGRRRVRHYVQGADRWDDADAWPPAGAVPHRLYLRGGGRLEPEAPGSGDEPASFVYDPNDPVPTFGGTFLGPRCGPADQSPTASRSDVRAFETPAFDRELRLAGPVRATLHVASDAPATDFTVKLVHLPANDGAPALNLCDGIRRLDPVPSGPTAVEIDLWHQSVVVKPGERLRVEVSSSNFPRYDAHPNVAGNPAHATTSRPARQEIHLSADAPSWIEIHVLA